MKDKNGVLLKGGATVLVPEPDETDIHYFPFTAWVESFVDDQVIVHDGYWNFFAFAPERLEVILSQEPPK